MRACSLLKAGLCLALRRNDHATTLHARAPDRAAPSLLPAQAVSSVAFGIIIA